jgi:hypothetical protein
VDGASIFVTDASSSGVGAPVAETDSWFAHVDASVAHVDASVQRVDASVAHVDASVQRVGASVDHVDAPLQRVDASVAHVDASVAHVDASVGETRAPAGVAQRPACAPHARRRVAVATDFGAGWPFLCAVQQPGQRHSTPRVPSARMRRVRRHPCVALMSVYVLFVSGAEAPQSMQLGCSTMSLVQRAARSRPQ